LANGAGMVRVIAGEFAGTRGPAKTFTPVNLWDLRLVAGRSVTLSVPDGQTTLLAVRHGRVTGGNGELLRGAELAIFGRAGDCVTLECEEDAGILLLGGEPIGQPIAAQGPFVMNTNDEIRQAIADFQSGRMGSLT
jgi:quercetin 2,3-dioxygenase